MNVNPDALRKETVRLLSRIEEEIEKFETASEHVGLSPFQIKDVNGNALYASLIVGKLSALNTLALLNNPKK